MNSDSRVTIYIDWSAFTVDLSVSSLLDTVSGSIERANGVISSKTFLVSEHKAAFMVEISADISPEEFGIDIAPVFGANFEVQPIAVNKSGKRRLSVVPVSASNIPTAEIQTQRPSPESKIVSQTEPEQTIDPTPKKKFRLASANIQVLKSYTPNFYSLDLAQRIDVWLRNRFMIAMATLAAVASVYQLLLRQLYGSGAFPNTTDAFAHLFRVQFVANEWKLGHLFPLWAPSWYQGTPLVQYYGPMVTIVMAPLAYLVNITFAYQAFTTLCFVFSTISVVLLFRSRIGTPGAIAAGILYPLSPFVIRTVFMGGALPATLVFALQPIFLRVLLDLTQSPSRRRFVYVAVISAIAISTHQLFAVMFMSSISGALILLALVHKNRRMAAGLAIGAIAIGIGLTSAWLFSSQTSLDFNNLPLPHDGETRFLTSRSFELFSPGQKQVPQDVYIGLGLVVFGLIGFVATRRRETSIVLAGASAICIFMAFGMNNPVITTVPFLDKFVFFERFLLAGALPIALLAGTVITLLVNWSRRQSIQFPVLGASATILVLLLPIYLLVQDSKPYYTSLVRQSDQQIWVSASEAIAQAAPEGRVADLVGRPEPAFFSYNSGRDSTTGWFLQGTSHWEQIGLLNHMLNVGHTKYVDRMLEQWWTAGAYVHEENVRAIAALEESGFAPLEFNDPTNSGITPWVRTDENSIVSRLDRNAIVVGRAHIAAAVVLPWASQSRSGDYSELSETVLQENSLVVLAESDANMDDGMQERLVKFRESGGVVLVLLGNDNGVWKADLNTSHIRFPDSFSVVTNSGEKIEEFSGLLQDVEVWEGLFVDDTSATTLLNIETEGGFSVPLLSRVDGDNGPTFVVGAAFYNMVFSWPDRFTTTAIEAELRKAIPDLSLTSGLTPLPTKIIENSSQRLKLEIENTGPATRALISTTYAPHWKTTLLDGEKVEIKDYERMIVVNVPAGTHTIELVQGIPSSYFIGSIFTTMTMIGLVFVLWKPLWVLQFTKHYTQGTRRRWDKLGKYLASLQSR
ncbi:MAG: hypothetical protein HQ477_12455 [Chloroflexi bacterium]|nr:hypothetical protein [Chloroflexota bacterium]